MLLLILEIKVVADAEKAIVEAMEKQFAEIISPLKESKIFGLKIVKKFTKGAPNPYAVPKEVCDSLFIIFVRVEDNNAIFGEISAWSSFELDEKSA